jgi:signal peptidase I
LIGLAVLVPPLVGAVVWARRRFVVVTVRGPSMEPTLREGDRVLVRRVSLAAVRAGQLVVAETPPPWRTLDAWQDGQFLGDPGSWGAADPPPARDRWMIKRAAAVPGEPVPASMADVARHLGDRVPPGRLAVLGDNAGRSHDSRRFGYLSGEELLGVVSRVLPGGG